jgi:hypothetical protein
MSARPFRFQNSPQAIRDLHQIRAQLKTYIGKYGPGPGRSLDEAVFILDEELEAAQRALPQEPADE